MFILTKFTFIFKEVNRQLTIGSTNLNLRFRIEGWSFEF